MGGGGVLCVPSEVPEAAERLSRRQRADVATLKELVAAAEAEVRSDPVDGAELTCHHTTNTVSGPLG